jgi:leader peptidase (prepilin peptidase)/N-methyltransferase
MLKPILTTGFIGLLLASPWLFLPPLAAVLCGLLGISMFAIAISDARNFIIPDILSLPAIPAGILLTPLLMPDEAFHEAALGRLGAAGLAFAILFAVREVYWVVRRREGLGLGDVKLAAAGGAWVGLAGLGSLLLCACLMAFAVIFGRALVTRTTLKGATEIPFGAFLAPSIWLVWTAQQLALAESVNVF